MQNNYNRFEDNTDYSGGFSDGMQDDFDNLSDDFGTASNPSSGGFDAGMHDDFDDLSDDFGNASKPSSGGFDGGIHDDFDDLSDDFVNASNPSSGGFDRGMHDDFDHFSSDFVDGLDNDFDDSTIPPARRSNMTADSRANNQRRLPDKKHPQPARKTPPPSSASAKQNKLSRNTGLYIALSAIILLTGTFLVYVRFSGNNSEEFDLNPKNGAELISETPSENDASQTQSQQDDNAVFSDSITYTPLHREDKNEDVFKMQQRLCQLGYLNISGCTGYYGNITAKKIKLFQKNAGLEVTGDADEETLRRLYADDAPGAAG